MLLSWRSAILNDWFGTDFQTVSISVRTVVIFGKGCRFSQQECPV
jgi:hypothetical protein